MTPLLSSGGSSSHSMLMLLEVVLATRITGALLGSVNQSDQKKCTHGFCQPIRFKRYVQLGSVHQSDSKEMYNWLLSTNMNKDA